MFLKHNYLIQIHETKQTCTHDNKHTTNTSQNKSNQTITHINTIKSQQQHAHTTNNAKTKTKKQTQNKSKQIQIT